MAQPCVNSICKIFLQMYFMIHLRFDDKQQHAFKTKHREIKFNLIVSFVFPLSFYYFILHISFSESPSSNAPKKSCRWNSICSNRRNRVSWKTWIWAPWIHRKRFWNRGLWSWRRWSDISRNRWTFLHSFIEQIIWWDLKFPLSLILSILIKKNKV